MQNSRKYAHGQYVMQQAADLTHVMNDVVRTKNDHIAGLYGNNDCDELVEKLNKHAEAHQEYAVVFAGRHRGKGAGVMYVLL